MSESAVSRLQFSDPDALAGGIRGGHLEPWVLDGHRVESELSRIMLPGSCLDRAEIGSSIWFRGEMPRDCYTMVYVEASTREGHSFTFGSRHRGECLGFYAPGETHDSITPPGYRNGTLTIPEAAFQRAVESGYPELSEKFLRKGRPVFPDADTCRRTESLLRRIMETVRQDPSSLEGETARAALENELHDRFFDLLRNDRTKPMAAGDPGISRRYRRLTLLRDYIRENMHRPIRMGELCMVGGLSRRGLEYLFMELAGVQVGTFLHRLRLQGARRELLATRPGHGSVKLCALNWGFWHLGRFAAEYRVLFGENPSDTLKKGN